MTAARVESWSVIGGVSGMPYRLYDRMRTAVNRGLAAFLLRSVTGDRIKMLEAGSGPGMCSSLLCRSARVAVSAVLDIDAVPLRIALKRDRSALPVKGSLYQLPFADKTFDLVFNSSTIEHLSKPADALCEMVRVCSPGGRIFVGVPYKYGIFFLWAVFPPESAIGAWMGKLYTKKDLLDELHLSGLKVVKWTFYFFAGFLGALCEKEKDEPCR